MDAGIGMVGNGVRILMNKHNHNVRFQTKDGITKIFLDGNEVKGCFEASLKWEVNELPIVDLVFHATEISVDIDDADVLQWKEVDVNARD